jgi:hypothetical protein
VGSPASQQLGHEDRSGGVGGARAGDPGRAQPRLRGGGVVASLSPQPYGWPVAGALLVAPADVDRVDVASELATFAPVPKQPLPFPSIVVASTDDPWVTIERAHSLAVEWGSHFVDYGPHGHINAASGLGYWPEGLDLLSRVLEASAGPHGEARSPGDARAILAQPRATHHEVRI